MAFIQCNFHSEVIGMDISFNAFIPETRKREKLPVLYLLHGLSDDNTAWQRYTNLEYYVKNTDLAVIMPNAHRSFYADTTPFGKDYHTYITCEIPKIASGMFNLSTKREENFIAGLSMGGYGALKSAFRNPDKFCFAASLSGAVDIGRENLWTEEVKHEFGTLYQDNKIRPENDLFLLSENYKDKLKVYQCCGTEDFLYKDNLKFKAHMENLNFDYTYEEGPGNHNWEYWDDKIKTVIDIIKKNYSLS